MSTYSESYEAQTSMSHASTAQIAHPDVGCARSREKHHGKPKVLAQSIEVVVVNHDLIKAFFLESNTLFDQYGRLDTRRGYHQTMVKRYYRLPLQLQRVRDSLYPPSVSPVRLYGWGVNPSCDLRTSIITLPALRPAQ